MSLRKIQLVEDDPFFGQLLIKNLKEHFPDREIQLFESANSVLDNLSDDTDLMILDYHLDGDGKTKSITGLELKRAINERGFFPPVIFLTAMDDIEQAVKILRDHGSDFIVKEKGAFNKLRKSIKDLENISLLDRKNQKLEKEKTDHNMGWFIVGVALILAVITLLILQ